MASTTTDRLFFFGGLVLLGLSGCGPAPTEAEVHQPVVVINDLRLSAEDLKQEVATAPEASHAVATANEKGKEPEWLSRLIERELLVQEAQRKGLDRDPEFMRTIERFWKEGLIKELLRRSSQEISSQVHVYDTEIEEYYKRMVAESPVGSVEPLPKIREEIRRTIRQQKEAQAMERWVTDLRSRAKIQINQREIEQLQ